MIQVAQFDDRPMQLGEVRNLVLMGDGPFYVSPRCFVDTPRPPGPGFVPCPECETTVVNAGEIVTISSTQAIWEGRTGMVIVDVSNELGESIELRVNVLSGFNSMER